MPSANINVTGTGTFSANNFTVPVGQTTVSFHSANAAVTICFQNSSTFGTGSIQVAQGGQPQDHNISLRVGTGFSVQVANYTNCASQGLKDDFPYTIDMSTPQGGKY
jgi:hypothetical protein